ncbi:aminotransferase class I/II-fold pyridoxal phosphate-dependent enzyme [Jejudonia soesokkakensis]|uniref:Aminotransferase class I/II-fold pyridoxal phosphate-dependent enzyme n=1 Tax=Jejudonia soesokkakensis TaxID=1323432 RepID=A0ABW2MR71_9FLAO
MLPKKLQKKIEERTQNNSLRKLGGSADLIDFSSNDYLGFSKNETIYIRALEILEEYNLKQNGAAGSRLLSGNHTLYSLTETQITNFHNAEAALVFNSGYDANLGFFSSVPQRGDVIFYDELCHASIRDGIRMSHATSVKFIHNDLEDLKRKCQAEHSRSLNDTTEVYLVTESVFSMDGDSPDLLAFSDFCAENNIHLIIDEAHAVGVLGKHGVGLVQELGIENDVFARIVTFGKALGCHGAAILGASVLKQYLVNFSRSLIYTTALPPHTLATITAAYEMLSKTLQIEKLYQIISLVQSQIAALQLSASFISSNTAIQSCIVPGNNHVKNLSETLKKEGFDIKPILSPTVPEGQERLRICIHSFNTEDQIKKMVSLLKEHL